MFFLATFITLAEMFLKNLIRPITEKNFSFTFKTCKGSKNKTFPATGREGLEACEILRILHSVLSQQAHRTSYSYQTLAPAAL
jgi:hypothetical protein